MIPYFPIIKKTRVSVLFMVLGLTLSFKGYSQNLDYNSKVELTLGNGTLVVLYAQLDGMGSGARPTKSYYYLPTQVQLSKDPTTNVPEFLF